MNEEKVLLSNLIQSKNNIKRKIMEIKRGVVDSDNYFRETFKPIIEPLNTIVEKKNLSSIQNNDNSDDNDNDSISEPGFKRFLMLLMNLGDMIKHLDNITINLMINLKYQISLLLLLTIIYMSLENSFHGL